MLGKLDIHMQNNWLIRLDPYLSLNTIYTKINWKWIKALTVRAQTESYKKIRGNLHGMGFGNDFLDMTQKAQATKEKNGEVELNQN